MNTNGRTLRLRDDLVILPVEGGLLIDRGADLELVKGVLSETLIPALLPRLDGTKSIVDLARELPDIHEDHLLEAVDILKSHHLLVENHSTHAIEFCSTQTYLNLYDWKIAQEPWDSERNAELIPASKRLEQAAIEISIADGINPLLADSLRALLEQSGVGVIRISHHAPRFRHVDQIAHLTLSWQNLDRTHSDSPISMYVGVGSGPSSILVGPVIRTKQDGCAACCDRGYKNTESVEPDDLPTRHNLIASLVAWEVIDVLLQSPSALNRNRVREYDMESVVAALRYFPCHQLVIPKTDLQDEHFFQWDERIDMASAYNDRIGEERYYQSGINALRNTMAATRKPELTVGRRYDLPRDQCDLSTVASRLLLSKGTPRAKLVTIHTLSAVCCFGAGIRDSGTPILRRWIPSAGNLGSVRVHLLTGGLDNLEQGLYSYDPLSHSLIDRRARLSSSVSNLAQMLTGKQLSNNQIIFILTARLDIVASKYKEFGCKLCYLDAGVAVAQFGLVCAALGLCKRIVPSWPEADLARELNLQEGSGLITSVFEMGTSIPVIRFAKGPNHQRKTPLHDLQSFHDLSMSDLTSQLMDEVALGAHTSIMNKGDRPIKTKVDARDLVRLPWPVMSPMSVAKVLDSRRSSRQFKNSVLDLTDLHALLRAAWINDKEEWKEEHEANICLNFSVLHRAAIDAKHSVFRFHPNHCAIEKLRGPLNDHDVERMFTQKEFTLAPTTIIVSANVNNAAKNTGAAAYRCLLVRAGAAAHRMWLMGLTFGLEGTLVAGLRTNGVRAQIEKDGECEAPLIACSLGYGSALDANSLGTI